MEDDKLKVFIKLMSEELKLKIAILSTMTNIDSKEICKILFNVYSISTNIIDSVINNYNKLNNL